MCYLIKNLSILSYVSVHNNLQVLLVKVYLIKPKISEVRMLKY